MTFICLPFVCAHSKFAPWTYINVEMSDKTPDVTMSYSLKQYLTEIKNQISSLQRTDDWDTYKKFTNTYEYINGYSNKYFCCHYKPLSRAYYKMIEIIHLFNIFAEYNAKPIKMFGLAEGPGGFIEAIHNYRNNARDTYVGMSIENAADDNVPGWKRTKHFLRSAPNVYLEKGADKTGNMLSIDNFKHVYNTHRNSVDIVTGDGGFDFSVDFNNQELSMHQLLFAQIAYAVCIQKMGGTFVLKMFDCFYKPTLDLLYLLSMFYNRVSIVKPCTSRMANSEKYIICTGFRYMHAETYYPFFERGLEACCQSGLYVKNFLQGIRPPLYFYSKIEEMNIIFGKSQIENIVNTLSLINTKYKNDKIDYLIKTNTSKCANWCAKHKILYYIPEPENPFVKR